MAAEKSFNTLAQSGTADSDALPYLSGKMAYGEGSDLTNKDAWKGRAKRKMITQKLMLALVDVVVKKGDMERQKDYWNTYHCQNNLFSNGGRIHGKYCKNRFCTVCCSIRKAEIINKYLPVISKWEDPHFVTLTVKAVPEAKLKRWFYGIQRAFRQIREKHKKRDQRCTGENLIGIKCLECNFNPITKTYNPHLHLIVPNEATAKILIAEWLRKWTKKFTSPLAQNMRRVENVESDLIELIKYGSKIFTEPDRNYKGQSKIPLMVYAAALDTILCAMKPYRLFERFGFNLPKQPKRCKPPEFLEQYEEWAFHPSLNDWYSMESGELLTGYIPTPQIRFLLGRMDTDLR